MTGNSHSSASPDSGKATRISMIATMSSTGMTPTAHGESRFQGTSIVTTARTNTIPTPVKNIVRSPGMRAITAKAVTANATTVSISCCSTATRACVPSCFRVSSAASAPHSVLRRPERLSPRRTELVSTFPMNERYRAGAGTKSSARRSIRNRSRRSPRIHRRRSPRPRLRRHRSTRYRPRCRQRYRRVRHPRPPRRRRTWEP